MKLSLFSKITIIIFFIQAIYAAVFFFHTIPQIKERHHKLERIAGIGIVNEIEAQIKLFSEQLKQYEKDALQYHKDKLKNIVDPYAKTVISYLNMAKNDKAHYREIQKELLEATRSFIYGKDDYIYIIDSKINMLSHPDSKLHGTNQAHLMDVNGLKILQEIEKLSKQKDSGYITYSWNRLGESEPVEKIAYYRYIPELDWIFATGVYLDDVKEEVKNRKEFFIDTLSFAIAKAVIGKTGYMYVFDDDCVMQVHPTMQIGTNFSKWPNPGMSESICKDLKESVIKSNGELFYKWDKPSDKKNYIYDKVSWVRYNKDFGLYLVSSAYMEELNESSEQIKEMILYTLAVLLATSSILAFIFVRIWLLRPINRLVETSNKIKDGDLDATSDINSSDEFGTLSDAFDDMALKLKTNMASLHRTMEKLEIAQDRALRASEAKSNFLANMSHEIRTPMNAVIGMGTLALKTVQDEKTKDYIEKSLNSSKLLLGIINDVLDFSKIEAGKLDVESIPFGIKKIITQTEDMFGFSAKQKGVDFRVTYDESIPEMVGGDPLRTSQVLNNLISNAIKFTEKGYVQVDCFVLKRDENSITVRFSVIDTGKGISKQKLENLFEEFSQEDASTSRMYGGTGLGLTICKKLVELMDGEIWAESAVGRGTTFGFVIPYALNIKVQDNKEIEMSPQSVSDSKILIIDDDVNALEVIGESLEHFSFEIDSVKSATEALQKVKEKEFDLMFIDWSLPDTNGIELYKKIKEIQPNSKAILISVYEDKVQKEMAIQAGFETFLPKPINQSVLLESVLGAIGRQSIYKNETPKIGSATKEAIKNSRILLAEDNAINREVAIDFLQDMIGSVDIAVNGKEALDMVLSHEPDYYKCVLMDIQMPIMDGYTASKMIRKDKRYATLPILALTANAMKNDIIQCLANGMNDHIPKPFNADELYNKLGFWIVRQSGIKIETTTQDEAQKENSKEVVSQNQTLDTTSALERLMGRQKLYFKTLKLFMNEKLDEINRIKKLLDAGEPKEAEMCAHSLKGVSNSIGAKALYELSRKIEASIKDNKSAQNELLELAQAEMDSVKMAIEDYLKRENIGE